MCLTISVTLPHGNSKRSLEITYTLLNREKPREKGNYLLCNYLFCRVMVVNKVPELKFEAT